MLWKILHTPDTVRELAMQRQPTPRMDPSREGHFLPRDQALKEAVHNPSYLTDLSDMPSSVGNPKKEETKKRKARDIKIDKDLKLKSWDGKKVRGFVTCFFCNKRRCLYAATDPEYQEARLAIRQQMESVSDRYSCGDLLFDDGHPLSTVIAQKQNLTCESQIEKGYYNKAGERMLKLKDLCIHCGAQADEEEDGFLLKMPQLRERNLAGGKMCYPICSPCLDSGKKVVKTGKADNIHARNDRISQQSSRN